MSGQEKMNAGNRSESAERIRVKQQAKVNQSCKQRNTDKDRVAENKVIQTGSKPE